MQFIPCQWICNGKWVTTSSPLGYAQRLFFSLFTQSIFNNTKLNRMKIFTLGLLLISSFALNAQQFVSEQEAVTIVSDMEIADMQVVESIQDPTDQTYIDKKFNIKAYQIISEILEDPINPMPVEGAIKRTIRNLSGIGGYDVTEAEYEANAIVNEQLKRIKAHLITLLTQ